MFKKIAMSFMFGAGMAIMGAVTGLMIPMAPIIAGLAAGFAGSAVVSLGQVGAALGMLGYGAGLSAAMLLLQPDWVGLAVWFTAFLMLGHILVQMQLKQKAPMAQVQLHTAAWLFIFGMASYVALHYLVGDGVSIIVMTLENELKAMEEISPQLYDMMLSMLSVQGFLPDVGFENYVLEMDAHTRLVLNTALIDMVDGSLRMSLLDVLVNQALHIALIAPLMTVMAFTQKGEGARVSKLPDLSMIRLTRKTSTILFILVVVLIVLMLFVDSIMPVYVAGMTIFEFAYTLQGLSVGEWFFRRKGMKRGLRYFILGLAFVLLPTVLFFLGFIEQLFSLRRIQQLKDSGEWARMQKEHEEEMERRLQELEEDRERLRRERDDEDDDSGKM